MSSTYSDDLAAAALVSNTFAGDSMASYYADQQFDKLVEKSWEHYLPEVYDALKAEQDRRKHG